jgi:hypothetical protein
MEVIQTLIANCPNNTEDQTWFSKHAQPMYDENGRRVYNEFWTAER